MVSSDGEGLKDGAERRVRWGDREGTQEEYDAFLASERERVDRDPELVAFFNRVNAVVKGAEDDLQVHRGKETRKSKAKGSPRSLYLSDETWEELRGAAVEAGFIRSGEPNVSAFVDAWVWNKLE